MTAITLSNINKRFGEKVLFRDYSLHIEAGEFAAIKGESGAGKTTLLNIIGLLETPDSGSVTLCGAKNPSFSSRAAVHLRRHKLSYLFQNYGLVDTDTVEANMKLATRFGKAKGKAEKERIADALAQVGLSGYERRKVYTLSGGEQQRVALAKIIAKSPDIILADEPTGSLDERNRSYVMDILKELNRQGKTMYPRHCPVPSQSEDYNLFSAFQSLNAEIDRSTSAVDTVFFTSIHTPFSEAICTNTTLL